MGLFCIIEQKYTNQNRSMCHVDTTDLCQESFNLFKFEVQ